MYKVIYSRNRNVGSKQFINPNLMGKFLKSNILNIDLLGVYIKNNGEWEEINSGLLNKVYVKGDKVVRCINSVYSDVEIVEVFQSQYRVLNLNSGLHSVISKDDVVDFISK